MMGTHREEPLSEYSPRSPWSIRSCALVTGLAYFTLARFSLLFVVQPEHIAGFWLPNGWLIGVLVLRPRRDWMCLLASGSVANVVANLVSGNSIGTSLGFALVNGLESLFSAWALVRYVGSPVTLSRLREVFGLVAVAGIPSCTIGGLLGAALITFSTTEATFWSVWRVWLVADVLGLLLMTPLVIAWSRTGLVAVRLLTLAQRLEVVGAIIASLSLTIMISQQPPDSINSLFIRPYLLIPFLLWVALRFGDWGASTGILAVSLASVWFTSQGRGLFTVKDQLITAQLLATQCFLLGATLMSLIVVAVMAERTRAREQLELVIRGTDAGIWDWNLLTNEDYHSPRWKSMLGYEDAELGSSFAAWESHVHPEDHSRALAAFREYLAGKRDRYEQEYRLRHKDGTYRWVLSRGVALRDATGIPLRVAGSNLDITASKQAEAELRESEHHFSAAFDDSPIGMDMVDLHGRFVRVNSAYCRMIGYTADQLLGMHIREVTHPEDLPRDESSMQEFLTGHRRTYQTEKRYIRSDGEIVWALLNVTVVADAEGKPLHFFGQVQDISQLKRDEEELRRQAQELARSNQELDDFAYIASHDLKTPLRGIDNLSKWISDDAEGLLPETSREHLRKLRQRIARLDRLLDDLLQYSRAGHQLGEVQPVQTGPLVRSIVELLNPPPGFVVNVADGMPLLTTHKTPLELVFRNLIDNAFKHHDRPVGHIDIAGAVKGRFVEFSVQDDGPGIGTEYHERIFRMFQTLKPRDESDGSGIGLAVVKKVVERHGGRVTIDSQPGRGTTFRFTWPR